MLRLCCIAVKKRKSSFVASVLPEPLSPLKEIIIIVSVNIMAISLSSASATYYKSTGLILLTSHTSQ